MCKSPVSTGDFLLTKKLVHAHYYLNYKHFPFCIKLNMGICDIIITSFSQNINFVL